MGWTGLARGLVVLVLAAGCGSRNLPGNVYDLARYDIVTPTIVPTADQLVFDASGVLWFLSVSNGALEAQVVSP
jgi:hypothetical protein